MSRTVLYCVLMGGLYAQSPGKPEYERHCALCHGMDATGGRGPSLIRTFEPAKLKRTIQDGRDPEMPAFWFLTEKDVDKIVTYVSAFSKATLEPVQGDPQHGERIYRSQNCSACHTVKGQGNAIGPDLTAIGAKRSASHLRESLTRPAATLPDQFLIVEATTSDGGRIRGVRANEDSFNIQIKDMSGRYHSFRKSDLAELKKLRGQTSMPTFTGAGKDLEDLIAYLASLKGDS